MEDSTTSPSTDRNEGGHDAFTFLTVSGRAPTQIHVFVHSCLADKKSGRNYKISGSPVAGPVFRYSTGKTGRVGKYGTDRLLLPRLCWASSTSFGYVHVLAAVW